MFKATSILAGSFNIAFLSDQWAVPVNTALLVLLALVTGYNARQSSRAKNIAEKTHGLAKDTQKKVETAERVAKEVGGTLRQHDDK